MQCTIFFVSHIHLSCFDHIPLVLCNILADDVRDIEQNDKG